MKLRSIFLPIAILALWAVTAVAAGPVATPEGVVGEIRFESMPEAQKAFGDPTDFKAAALAGADYIRYMQADITEDNAGNGDPDTDTQDAGWDWSTALLEHSSSHSWSNLHGVIANSVFQAYLLEPSAGLFTTMQDVADHSLATGPEPAYPVGLRYAGDIMFLLNFATLPGVANPADYQNHALHIWNWRLANYGDGTAEGFAIALMDGRHNQGYDNGIGPWDVSAYIEAIAMLDVAFPGNGYAADAVSMAEVLYQDSFMLNPGYFDFDGRCMGYDPDYINTDYYWYGLGVSGLINAFEITGIHASDLPLLETRLLECQYDDGAFGDQYGTPTDVNTRDYQTSAYALMTLANHTAPTATNLDALYNGAYWLAYWQDVSGGFLYSGGTHYPEIGAEAAAGLAGAWALTGSAITASTTGADPAQCGATKVVTFNYAPTVGTPGLRGYELTLEVTGPVDAIAEVDFADAGLFSGFGNHYFDVVDNGDGTWTVNDAILGATGGLTTAGDMFNLTLITNGDGAVDVSVLSYKLRDPDNVEMFADVSGDGFIVDCTAPGAVDSFTGAPGHEKADLDWTMADISDVAAFEIYRAVWYDGDSAYDSAYPEYDDLANDIIPARPGSRAAADGSAEWTLVYTTVANSEVAYTDNETVRGVYYYEIFAMDAAGNYGPPAADAVWVMNYWLGDVSDGVYAQFDGEVEVADVTALGSYFGLTNIGLNHPGNHVDVGPTHDNSRLGIPETDDSIDFEDLMIFAMNYQLVSPAKSDANVGSTAYLAWTQLEDGRYAVRVNQANGMQGLHVTGNVKVNAVTAGDLISAQEEMTFLTNVGSRLDANVAVMGADNAFVGDGDLLIINASGSIDFEDLVFDARGSDNSEMEVSFEQTSGATMPSVYSLESNYPNPFNPMTKISFSLPEAQAVKLTVYGLDGRKVATLVNEERDAGTYEVNWMGRDDQGQLVASGTYFYRIDAGPYSQARKMTLMK